MPDLLIRGFPADDLARLGAHAARLGLSRTEYIRRRLCQDARRAAVSVTVGDLGRFADSFADLADDSVMSEAWR
ncbi:MAG: antitoxin [Acidimicrobiia bacterium]|nr:antitoxin [Acidimicrobiia bacterium]